MMPASLSWVVSVSPFGPGTSASSAFIPHAMAYLGAGFVSGTTFVASDIVAQLFLHNSRSLQWMRLARLGLFGFAVKGPLQSLYYSAVEQLLPSNGGLAPVRVQDTTPPPACLGPPQSLTPRLPSPKIDTVAIFLSEDAITFADLKVCRVRCCS
jgi:hypothetical protein